VAAAGLLAALACGGCGARTGDVWGTVTYQGTPVPAGSIAFLSADKKPVGSAAITNGKYAMTRVPVGKVTVIVLTPPAPHRGNVPPPPPPRGKRPGKDQPPIEVQPEPNTTPRVQVPEKYGNPDESDLTYEVQPGTQEHNVAIP
jgi:hypothetical protein